VTTTIHERGGAASKFNHEWHEEEIFNRKEPSAASRNQKRKSRFDHEVIHELTLAHRE